MTVLSDRVLQMEEAATLKMARLARELTAEGNDVISLSLGEPDFDTPDYIKEFASQALRDGYTKYTPVAGIPELREAVSRKFKEENGLEYAPDEIVASTGAKQSIANTVMALVNPGDEVIFLAPYWVSYRDIVKLAGGTPVYLTAGVEADFKVSPDQLAKAISSRTRLIILNSPCNPSGSVYSKQELEGLAEVVSGHEDLFVISDEIYEHITYGVAHHSIGTVSGMKDRVITINGMSKAFAMTGWRLGYLGAPRDIAMAIAKVQGQFTSGPNAAAQKASALALSGPREACHSMCDAYRKRRDLIVGLISDVQGMKVNNPHGAFYLFPDVTALFGQTFEGFRVENSVDLSEYLLTQAHVATVPGEAFGLDACIRLSYATSEDKLVEAASRIGRALSNQDRTIPTR